MCVCVCMTVILVAYRQCCFLFILSLKPLLFYSLLLYFSIFQKRFYGGVVWVVYVHMHICGCGCLCVCVCTHPFKCIWRSEEDAKCPLLLLFPWDRLSHCTRSELLTKLAGQQGPRIHLSPLPSPRVIGTCSLVFTLVLRVWTQAHMLHSKHSIYEPTSPAPQNYFNVVLCKISEALRCKSAHSQALLRLPLKSPYSFTEHAVHVLGWPWM